MNPFISFFVAIPIGVAIAIVVGIGAAFIRARLAQARLDDAEYDAKVRAHRWGR